MSRPQFFARLYLSLAIVCLILSLPRNARAAGDPNEIILLDSQVYQSDLVVEGRIVEPARDQLANNGKVRVTAVYRGDAKVGDIIRVLRISDFQKQSTSKGGNILLGPKDDLVLFLLKSTVGEKGTPSEGVGFLPLVGSQPFCSDLGFRLVVRGRVYPFLETISMFSQGRGPNPPFVAGIVPSLPWAFGDPGDLAVEYRKRLRASAAFAGDAHAHFDRTPTAADIPWLISLLKQRYVPLADHFSYIEWREPHQIATDAAKQVAKLRSLVAVDQAICADPNEAFEFQQALGTPLGRDFLLERITDPALSTTLRKTFVGLISSEGAIHSAASNKSAATRPGSREEPIAAGNDSYLTRIVRGAVKIHSAGDDGNAAALMEAFIQQVSKDGVRERDPQIELDLTEAATALRDFYARKDLSEEMRFHIECGMCAIGGSEYATLKSSCGAMPTLACLARGSGRVSGWAYPPITGTIDVGCSYHRTGVGDRPTMISLVLEAIPAGMSCVIPSKLEPKQDFVRSRGYTEESIPLPPSFKPGRYRVHYRLMEGAKIVGDGHGFEITLPQLASSPATPAYPWPMISPASQPWPTLRKVGVFASIFALPTLLILRAIARSLRQHRRARKGLCPQCAYDLRSSRDRCPECGTPVSASMDRALVRKCVARIILTTSIIFLIATIVGWVRSYRVADCWVRTTSERADSIYYSRGAVVVNLLTTVGPPGWSHIPGEPLAFPRSMAESGDLPRWRILGVEYSTLSDMLIVPMWAIAGLLAIGGLFTASCAYGPGRR